MEERKYALVIGSGVELAAVSCPSCMRKVTSCWAALGSCFPPSLPLDIVDERMPICSLSSLAKMGFGKYRTLGVLAPSSNPLNQE